MCSSAHLTFLLPYLGSSAKNWLVCSFCHREYLFSSSHGRLINKQLIQFLNSVWIMVAELIFNFILVFLTTTCVQATAVTAVTTSSALLHDYNCPTWYTYNLTNGQCVCTNRGIYKTAYYKVECSENGATIAPGYCATYEEGHGTLIAICLYFQPNAFSLTPDGYYPIPHNISHIIHKHPLGSVSIRKALLTQSTE